MKMYEFNLWEKQTLKEKIVKEFKTDEEASAFINGKWKDTNLLFTWAPLTGYKYNEKAPVRIPLSDEEVRMKKDLRDSITPETKEEWGYSEMSSHVQEDMKPHPNAKGYRETR
jgi:hypothetical protein|tara:strand:+ start:490 stop:828 length:339 start_codon:yes stop_codon:yes gene_type:complete